MRISFSPQRRDDTLEVIKDGDVLTINGEDFDFSVIPEGATLPAEAVSTEFLTGEISRVGGDLQITLVLPHGPSPSQAVAFPMPIEDAPDGQVDIPRDPAEAIEETIDE